MEYVLLAIIILFVGAILGLLVGVVREFYLQKRLKAHEAEMAKFRDDIKEALTKIAAETEPLKAFLLKAHTDLDTIVKEYEINGVPLGYDRGKKAEFIEGL